MLFIGLTDESTYPFVQDTGSLNGTQVNNKTVEASARVILDVDDEIVMGKATRIKVLHCVCSSCDEETEKENARILNEGTKRERECQDEERVICMICSMDLSGFPIDRRRNHVNECCDESSKQLKKPKKSTRGKRRKIKEVKGSVEEIENRIRQVDKDLESLQEYRKTLGKNNRMASIDMSELHLVASLEKTKSLQQLKKSATGEVKHYGDMQKLTDVLFADSQREPKQVFKETEGTRFETTRTEMWDLTSLDKEVPKHVITVTSPTVSTPCQDTTTAVVQLPSKDESLSNLNTFGSPLEIEKEQGVDENTKNTSNVTVGLSNGCDKNVLSEAEMVEAITNSVDTEDLYFKILVDKVVELDEIQKAIQKETGKRVNVKTLTRFLDEQGVTYKQY